LLQGITEKRLKNNKSNKFSHSVMPLGVEWSSGSKHPPEVEPPLSSTWVGCLLPELSTPLMVLYTKGVRSIHFRTLLKQSVDVSHSDPKNRLLEKWFWWISPHPLNQVLVHNKLIWPHSNREHLKYSNRKASIYVSCVCCNGKQQLSNTCTIVTLYKSSSFLSMESSQ
jgi:hypothetical protein